MLALSSGSHSRFKALILWVQGRQSREETKNIPNRHLGSKWGMIRHEVISLVWRQRRAVLAVKHVQSTIATLYLGVYYNDCILNFMLSLNSTKITSLSPFYHV